MRRFLEDVNLAQEINSFCLKWLVFYEFQIKFVVFEKQTVLLTVHDKIQLVCIILEVYT